MKMMVGNATQSSTPLKCTPPDARQPATRSREIILSNMRQSASLTLRILKSLYPWADLDAVGEGFVVTYSDEEALKLMEDSTIMAGQIVDMSLG
jgi:hypothetical protein